MLINGNKLKLCIGAGNDRTDLSKKIIDNWLSNCPNDNVRKAQINDLNEDFKSLYDQNLFNKGKYFILKDSDGDINGCICLEPKDDKKVAELKCFYVNPNYRSQGYGKLLIEELIKDAKSQGIEKLTLVTISYLETAIKIYDKYGFKKIDSFVAVASNGTWIHDKSQLNKDDKSDEYEVLFYELIL